MHFFGRRNAKEQASKGRGGLLPALAGVGAMVAAAGALVPSAECPHQGSHSCHDGGRHDEGYEDVLYHISRLPIWKNRVLAIHARPMV